MKDNWNPGDWQGRSKKQVESSETLAGISMIAIVVMVVGMVVYNIVKNGV